MLLVLLTVVLTMGCLVVAEMLDFVAAGDIFDRTAAPNTFDLFVATDILGLFGAKVAFRLEPFNSNSLFSKPSDWLRATALIIIGRRAPISAASMS